MKKIDVKNTVDAYKKIENFDPNGSYTGTPDSGKTPTQDADDL